MIYLIATPIGNLEDITLRAVRVLGECDAVYAEDTRHTLGLLNHLNIKKPLTSCHEHNERERAAEIVARSQQGECIAVVSDAGMPGISDPGAAVVQAAIEANEPFTVLPGASAALTSAVLSGLPCDRFCFEGFLPRDKKPRRERLEVLKTERRTAVIYESPFRLKDTLDELCAALGDRNAAVCRELTKVHEECARGSLSELSAHFSQGTRGECVIVLGGAAEEETAQDAPTLTEQLDAMRAAVSGGEKPRAAAKRIARGMSASELYNQFMYLKEKKD